MAHVFAISTAEEWPRHWQLHPYEVHRVPEATPQLWGDASGAVVIVPRGPQSVAAAVRAVEQAKRETGLAVLLADRADSPALAATLLEHEFDGFLDLAWPASLARAAIDTACRNVELGRNIVLLQRTVLEQSRQETSELYEQTVRDDLTQLYNHRHFVSLIEREHRRCMASRRPYALVFVDLDDLKKLNTELGHEGGSEALRQVASVLTESLGPDDVAMRIGGDEFVLLMLECNHDGALERARQVCRSVAQRNLVMQGHRVQLSVSAGVAAFPEDGFSGTDLLRRADEALLQAKAAGKNCAVPWRALEQPDAAAARAS